MPSSKYLIVNADDYGLSPGVNRGIIRAHEEGIVTSASLMVRWPAAAEAAAYARSHPQLSVGLHVDLCEWRFINDAWHPAYQVVPTHNAAAVADEVARQLDAFRQLMGRDPTHLDSHQHVHRTEPVRSILLREARRLRVVLRDNDPEVRYCGDFYGQSDKGYPYHEGISVRALFEIIGNLPGGITELACHPGEAPDLSSVYGIERLLECRTLCNPQVRAALRTHNVVLCPFPDRRGYGVDSRMR
jgi:predicted glycoside hydrolase/deacetylase ChbG (UPF0249 family)